MAQYSVVGLGKLGASMAAAIASRGHQVVGLDIDEEHVRRINRGEAPVQETQLADMIAANTDRLRATTDMREAVHETGMTFTVVPTPSDDRGAFSLRYLRQACREIGRALRSKTGHHDVVITSTVLPGSTRYGLLPILERQSGKSLGDGFGLCYSPQFIALGSVIEDFLTPDFTLIGEFDDGTGARVEEAYDEILTNDAPCKRVAVENAELAKVALNTFVTMKVTFANMIADLCERLPRGDVDAVTDVLGEDRRIGHAYLTGALGYGGPCFPRDNQALSFLARRIGTDAALAEVTDEKNRALPQKVTDRLDDYVGPGTKVAVLGLAYKPQSHVIEESQGVYLARAMVEAGADVTGFDPLVEESAIAKEAPQIELMDSLQQCVSGADVILITTRDARFRRLTGDDMAGDHGTVAVVDFWRILPREVADDPRVEYIPWGRDPTGNQNADVLRSLWSPSAEGAAS